MDARLRGLWVIRTRNQLPGSRDSQAKIPIEPSRLRRRGEYKFRAVTVSHVHTRTGTQSTATNQTPTRLRVSTARRDSTAFSLIFHDATILALATRALHIVRHASVVYSGGEHLGGIEFALRRASRDRFGVCAAVASALTAPYAGTAASSSSQRTLKVEPLAQKCQRGWEERGWWLMVGKKTLP